MELALKCWFLEQQDKVNLSGDMLRAKAACFPQELHPNAPEMALSQGWLEKFKDRHEIKSFRCFGESDALDMEAIGAMLPDICVVGDAYIEKDVFNMDETGLYWRLQADNSLATHQLEGRKINKEHITLVICANSNNNEKIPLTIIDKHLNPRCFKGIKCDTLGARYHANAKAWMTQNVFQLWLLDFDRQMQGCQILLLLDNYPGHIPLEKFAEMNVVLRNTHVFYLPPNMTSVVQPCDVGIIHTFKMYYRKRFNNLLLDGYENNIDNLEKINIFYAFRLPVPARVEDVLPATIANCFRYCKIRTSDIIHTQQGEVGPPTALIQELQHQMVQLPYGNPMDIRNLLNYPEENNYIVASNDEDITNHIIEELRPQQDEDAASDNDDSVEPLKISTHQAQEYLEGLTLLWMQQKESYHEFSESLK